MGVKRGLATLALAGMLALCTTGAHAQTALDSPLRQWAQEELAEAQMRNRFQESQRLFARKGSDEIHAMVEREGKRARRSVSILLLSGLILLLLFGLPLSVHDKVAVPDQLADENQAACDRSKFNLVQGMRRTP